MPEFADLKQSLLTQARSAWPALTLPDDIFFKALDECARQLAEDEGRSNETAMGLLHVEDLYLAQACVAGDSAAVKALEETYFNELDRALAELQSGGAEVEEVKQKLRQKLLVGDGERQPRLALYSGRGALRRWVQVSALREGLQILRKEKRGRANSPAALAELAEQADDPELRFLKQTYRREFKRAFEEALRSLSARERNVLRYHLIDGLNIDGIGAIYAVHRSTVARWIARTRELLHDRTREILAAKVKVAPREFDSIVRLIGSQLDASVCRILMETDPDTSDDPGGAS